jgi:Rrf2 family protein
MASMKLSRTVEYAVQAVLQLAQHDEKGQPVPCSHLASEGMMPERFLLQILRGLVTHGILSSTRGVDGGYALKRDPQEISLLELIEAVDGPLKPGPTSSAGMPEETQKAIADALGEVTKTLRRQLAAIKLTSLMPPRKNGDGHESHE